MVNFFDRTLHGLFDNEFGRQAYDRARNGYYETHKLPEGFTPEMVTITDEALDRAVKRTLTEMFQLSMFENTYRDARKAKKIVSTPSDWENAERAHRQSVVFLKNDGTLPLKAEGKKVYAEAFHKNPRQGEAATAALKEMLRNVTLVEDYNDVPGYDKDPYMPDSLKDENGKAYAYRDANGSYYELNFGLTY